MMLEELERRDYTDTTIRHYLRFVEEFAQILQQVPRQGQPRASAQLPGLSAQTTKALPRIGRAPRLCTPLLLRAHPAST